MCLTVQSKDLVVHSVSVIMYADLAYVHWPRGYIYMYVCIFEWLQTTSIRSLLSMLCIIMAINNVIMLCNIYKTL